MSPQRYLVTGAAGFIGSWVAGALLARGDSVIVVDELNDYYDISIKHENLNILFQTAQKYGSYLAVYKADVSDAVMMERIFEQERPDYICHLAARAGVRPSIKDPDLYIKSNINGTVNLLECAKKYKIKNFVYASSSSVYGKNAKVPFSEDDMTDNPVSPYAATKKACELMAATYHNLYGINVSGLRFFTVYGPRGRPDMAPYMFVDRITRGIPIDQFGDGTSCRDYTFVSDIVNGVIAALDRPRPCEVYNLGNNQTVMLKEFIQVIEEAVGKKAIINLKPDQPGDVPVTYADLTKSQAMLDYSPKMNISDGIRELVKWYNSKSVDPRLSYPTPSPPPIAMSESEEVVYSDSSDLSSDDESVHAPEAVQRVSA